MLDRPEQTGGKINWPAAIAVSAAVHAVLIGVIWLCTGSGDPSGPAAAEAEHTEAAEAPASASRPVPSSTEEQGSRSTLPVVPPSSAGAAAVAEETVVHTVASGENLAVIARRYGCSVEEIVQANGLKNPNALALGQKLKVPARKAAGR